MRLWKFPILLLSMGLAVSCSDNQPAKAVAHAVSIYPNSVQLHGAVSNNNGLIKSGKIQARSVKGDLLAETVLKDGARYQLDIPSGTELPVVLSYLPEETKDGVEKMISVAVQPTISKYDINPLTTAIAKKAESLGGYTLRNLTQAAEDGVHVPDANKTSTGFRGDPTTQYGGWH